MAAELIDGKIVAASVRERVARDAAELTTERGRAPGLATVLVGEDPASHIYVRRKREACAEVGISSVHHELDAGAPADELRALVRSLNNNALVDGILVQMPLPAGHDPDAVIREISPGKDVDGLTAANAGLVAQGQARLALDPSPSVDAAALSPGEALGLAPATPQGVMELLRSAGTDPEGANAVIVGRSTLVGRPLAALLLAANATVTVCHSRTRDLPAVCRRADILVAAVGSPRLVGVDWVQPGATVVDVGVNRVDGGLVGDVDFDPVRGVAGAITPVPGGVGPMTIALVLANTVLAARLRPA
jgi:methylenetetrahydrofolate dehydrogenase (NADP+)/methenyltetrahydrofolate cyclohydrolase